MQRRVGDGSFFRIPRSSPDPSRTRRRPHSDPSGPVSLYDPSKHPSRDPSLTRLPSLVISDDFHQLVHLRLPIRVNNDCIDKFVRAHIESIAALLNFSSVSLLAVMARGLDIPLCRSAPLPDFRASSPRDISTLTGGRARIPPRSSA